MAIDFTLSDAQKNVQQTARDFAQNVLAPVVREADAEPDPLRAFQKTKPAYVEAYKRGIAFGMLPKQYGGGGLTNVELILAAEEICAVDPGFACTILVNGLGLMPVWYWGTEEQKRRFIGAATSDPTGEYIVGYAASEPAGTPGGTANFDAPLPAPGRHRRHRAPRRRPLRAQRPQVLALQRRRLGRAGRQRQHRGGTHRPGQGRHARALSAIMVERGTPGVSYQLISKIGHRLTPNAEIVFDNARVPAANLVEGTRGNGDLLINRNFAWSGPVAGIAAVGVARSAYEACPEMGEDLHRRRTAADHLLPERRLRPRRRGGTDRDRAGTSAGRPRTTSTSTTTTAN